MGLLARDAALQRIGRADRAVKGRGRDSRRKLCAQRVDDALETVGGNAPLELRDALGLARADGLQLVLVGAHEEDELLVARAHRVERDEAHGQVVREEIAVEPAVAMRAFDEAPRDRPQHQSPPSIRSSASSISASSFSRKRSLRTSEQPAS
jgi:hypothetical protein